MSNEASQKPTSSTTQASFRVRTARRISALVTLTMVAEFLTMPIGGAAVLSSAFELDGNATASASLAGDDWSDLSHKFDSAFIAEPSSSDTTYYNGGGSKDILD